jgi:hypothetical protein
MTAVVSVAVVAAAPMVRERARDKITVLFMRFYFLIIITVVWRLDDESTSTGAEGLPLVLLGG